MRRGDKVRILDYPAFAGKTGTIVWASGGLANVEFDEPEQRVSTIANIPVLVEYKRAIFVTQALELIEGEGG